MFVEVGNDAQDLPHHRIEPLGILPYGGFEDSPDRPSPQPMYRTRQSGLPGLAAGSKISSPMGCDSVLSCRRITSRAVPSKVEFAVVCVCPFNDYGFACGWPRRSQSLGSIYSLLLQPGKVRVIGKEEPGSAGSSR